jgi:hypothetical protein
MIPVTQFKYKLIEELWLPTTQKWGNVLHPRAKKVRRLRLLTLTSDVSFEEVTKFEKEELTQRECVVAWNFSHFKKLRLETEISPAKVYGPPRYENCASSASFPIKEYFPFDVINLDFSSQDPALESGRIEKEIGSIENTIKLQKTKGSHSFILVYTTVLNANALDYESIVQTSNNIAASGWSGLTSEEFDVKIGKQKEKMKCIETVVSKMCSKYGYNCKTEMKDISIGKGDRYVIYSVAVLAC